MCILNELYKLILVMFKPPKELLLFIVFVICQPPSQSQAVQNDFVRDYQLIIHEVNYYNNGNEGSNPEPAWEFSWSETQPLISACNNNTDFTSEETPICVTAPDETRHIVDKIAVSKSFAYSSDRVHWKIEGWENDDFNSDDYCDYDTGDDEYHCGSGTINPFHPDAQGRELILSSIGMGSSSWKPKLIWAYRDGNWSGKPLTFGFARVGKIYSHTNTNRTGPRGFGYQDEFSLPDAPKDSSPEVVYRIYNNGLAKEFELSLDDNLNDSYIHIVQWEDLQFKYIETIRGNNPSAVRTLCEGTYYFIIEPVGGVYNHDFTFEIKVHEADHDSVDPGKIDYPHNYYVINQQLPLAFSNVQSGSHESISVDYTWTVRRVYIYPNGFEESFDSAPEDGEASQFLQNTYDGNVLLVRRTAWAQCLEATSNTVTIQGLNPTISNQDIADLDCEPSILVNNSQDKSSIVSGIYQSNFIVGQGTGGNASTIHVKVQDSLVIESGFTIEKGGVMEVNIEICDAE